MNRPQPSPLAAQTLLFAVLVAIGVVGRWGQPDWAVTPIAAVGLLAGYALPGRAAIAVPLTALLITDIALPSYGSLGLAVVVYSAMTVAPLLGVLLRRPVASRAVGAARLVALAATPAVVFFVTTNLGVWAFTGHYPPTLVGLAECYTAALPFFRRMLVGDLAYVAATFGCCAAAGAFSLRGLTTGSVTVERA